MKLYLIKTTDLLMINRVTLELRIFRVFPASSRVQRYSFTVHYRSFHKRVINMFDMLTLFITPGS